MSVPVAGEAVFFHRYETDHYEQYNAVVRAADANDPPELNLSWFNASGTETQANNIKNVEDSALGATEDYWRRRYGDVIKARLQEITGHLETVRVENGDMIFFRPWNVTTKWKGGFIGVVVATLGAPSAPHPVINLRYVNDSGTSTLASNTPPIEEDGETASEGNDLWSNVPDWLDG